ncbi:hypothetical protein A0J52_06600 [Clostridium sporogenes]|uniref:hypothetical protein n=1 Tax=Clostridium sporogenes TaxID=1509 RepID=UPI00078006E2|nr:hypothetical protein [Clostridium sporogenes]KYN78947.1 hypothetical protein A0J52_06600 [Clostridium sporogenes]
MIIEALAVGALAKTFYSADKSLKMDEKALKKYAKAFERSEEAELLVKKKAEFGDKRLMNVAKKKRAIVQSTVPKFIDVYSKIQKIELENKTEINEIAIRDTVRKLAVLDALSVSVKKDFSDKELVCGLITKGFCKMMEINSERYLSAANSQMRAANVIYSQSESIGAVYDAIVSRADRISNLLMSMNALFIRSINETAFTIEKNGLNVRNYSDYDKGVLMTCVNIAAAMSDIIDVPVVDEKGQICESAMEMITTGEKYLEKMNQAVKE